METGSPSLSGFLCPGAPQIDGPVTDGPSPVRVSSDCQYVVAYVRKC